MLKSARKKEKDPEGRMPLVDHLRELRNRLAKGMLAITVVSVVAAFYSNQLMSFLMNPVPKCTKGLGESTGGHCAVIAYTDLLSPFTTTLTSFRSPTLTAGNWTEAGVAVIGATTSANTGSRSSAAPG